MHACNHWTGMWSVNQGAGYIIISTYWKEKENGARGSWEKYENSDGVLKLFKDAKGWRAKWGMFPSIFNVSMEYSSLVVLNDADFIFLFGIKYMC